MASRVEVDPLRCSRRGPLRLPLRKTRSGFARTAAARHAERGRWRPWVVFFAREMLKGPLRPAVQQRSPASWVNARRCRAHSCSLPLFFPDLATALGSTIKNFTITNSSDPSMRGRSFFRGSHVRWKLSIDTGLIPANGSRATIVLASFDVSIAPPSQPVVELSSAGSFSAGSLVLSPGISGKGLDPQFDELQFAHAFPNEIPKLDRGELAGSFSGELVWRAAEEEFAAFPPVTRTGFSESAFIVDPALVPESTSMGPLGAGAAGFAALRRRNSLHLARRRLTGVNVLACFSRQTGARGRPARRRYE